MAKAKTPNELRQVQALAIRVNDQLCRLYENLGKVVTAAGTLNEELSELPSRKDLQDVVSILARLRKELGWFLDPGWVLPDSGDLNEAAEAARALVTELTRVNTLWRELPSNEEIKAKIDLLRQCDERQGEIREANC